MTPQERAEMIAFEIVERYASTLMPQYGLLRRDIVAALKKIEAEAFEEAIKAIQKVRIGGNTSNEINEGYCDVIRHRAEEIK
jgi:hypothetical protein